MAAKVFTEAEAIELLKKNEDHPLGARNAALIIAGLGWGLTPLEISLVTTKDIVGAKGGFYSVWNIPPEVAHNKATRRIHNIKHLMPYFNRYIDFRVCSGWGVSGDDALYKGLSPESNFFLNDFGQPYKPTERKEKSGSFQPRSMNEQLIRMIARTDIQGATPASYRDTFIKMMYEKGCRWKDLKDVSGIKQKRTLEGKVFPAARNLDDVLSSLLSGINPIIDAAHQKDEE